LVIKMLQIAPMNTSSPIRRVGAPKIAAAKKLTRHVNTDSLSLHVLGDLPILQQREVEEHLSECGSCRTALRHIAEVIAVFRAVPYQAAA
jgi:hypothetical protein